MESRTYFFVVLVLFGSLFSYILSQDVSAGGRYFMDGSKFNATWKNTSRIPVLFSVDPVNATMSVTILKTTEVHLDNEDIWNFTSADSFLDEVSQLQAVKTSSYANQTFKFSSAQLPDRKKARSTAQMDDGSMFEVTWYITTNNVSDVSVDHLDQNCDAALLEPVQQNCSCRNSYEITQGSLEFTVNWTNWVPVPLSGSSISRALLMEVQFSAQFLNSYVDNLARLNPAYQLCDVGTFVFGLPQFDVLVNLARTARVGDKIVEVIHAFNSRSVALDPDIPGNVIVPVLFMVRWEDNYNSTLLYDPDVTFLLPNVNNPSENNGAGGTTSGNNNKTIIIAVVVSVVGVAIIVSIALIILFAIGIYHNKFRRTRFRSSSITL
eukprot:TRINITY_DN25595_c0_g1_i1.p1 TRINITY_DN25595_c0_g1~~TRINITY_DN25595_c0_g1_i1.p1  ORF type:complete len:379 (+),score=24.49 TRINITY_DN25595_c0_g1_i1:24-1160(+)